MFDLTPSTVALILFSSGWLCGWAMLCRPRRLGEVAGDRPAVTVVVPARDEAHAIGAAVTAIVRQCRRLDEVIVVDDGSSDGTGDVAEAAGARVIRATAPAPGWAGKTHACATGAASTETPLLVFMDADVVPQPDVLDALATELDRHPGELVSVQPWHTPRASVEQLSLLFNITALMGCAAFTVLGDRVRTRVAFGPLMAFRRTTYDACGGHAGAEVRGAVLEDIALARAVGRSRLFVGGSDGTTFRMYPGGLRPLVEGWTKGMGIGASATPWWALVATAAWVTSVAGGWLASPWFALATLAQLGVFARIAGRFSLLVILLYPVATAFFVAIFVRSALRRTRRGTVTWKGRTLRPDQATD
jgi:4,4'-diaponeurosporenoate glycosyltransferase